MFVGRAAESLARHVKKKPLSEVLNEKCQGAWAGGTLASPLGVDVDEFGFVSICPRLNIGDTRQKSLGEILENYDYRDHTVIATLHDSGMKGLYKLASEIGFVPRKSYVNGCHLCYKTRKFLNQRRISLPMSSVCDCGKSMTHGSEHKIWWGSPYPNGFKY